PMGDVQLHVAHQRISTYMRMPFCCLAADINFTVLKRQDVGRSRFAAKLAMHLRHPAIGNKPNENPWQFAQIRLFPLSHLQTMAQSFRGDLLKPVNLDWYS